MDTYHGHTLGHIRYGHMWPYGHMATYGHNQYCPKYGHDGYPRKENRKTNSAVKESSDLDFWPEPAG